LTAQGFSFPHTIMKPAAAARVLGDINSARRRSAHDPGGAMLFGVMKPHLLYDWADRLARNPEIVALARAVLGADLLLWSMDVFALRPRSRSQGATEIGEPQISETGPAAFGFDWHQDSIYLGFAPVERSVRIWLAITDSTVDNGAMRYAPGSHRLGDLPHCLVDTHNPSRGERVEFPVEDGDTVDVILDAGQCSVHNLRIIHSSGVNRSRRERVAVALTYVAASVVPAAGDSALPVAGSAGDTAFALETPITALDLRSRHAQFNRSIERRMNALSVRAGAFAEIPKGIRT